MKKNPQALDETLQLTAIGDGLFSGVILPTWSQGRACYGGILLAMCSRATRLFVSPDRRLLSINITYVGPVAIGAVEVQCEPLRKGSSVSHLECRILQDGKPRVVAVVSYGTRRPGSLDMPRIELPDWAGEPGAGMELPYVPPLSPEFTQHLDYRWEAPYMPLGGAKTPCVRGWLRPALPAPLDEAQILVMLNAFPPPLWSQATAPFPASSLSSHFQMVDAFPQDIVHPWFYYDGPASVIGEGYSDVRARLWHEDGTLVAIGAQQFADFSGRAQID